MSAPRVPINKDRVEPQEELLSRSICELVDLKVFGEYWKSLFGDKAGMLVEEALSIEPEQRAAVFGKDFVRKNRIHHKGLSVDGGKQNLGP